MSCKNHPNVESVTSCGGCGEPFCGNCVVKISGESFCVDCKSMAVSDDAGPMGVCEEANEALKYAIVGLFCFGIILEPIAISKALKAKKIIAANPRLSGDGKATAAMLIGFIGLGLWVLGMIARVSAAGR